MKEFSSIIDSLTGPSENPIGSPEIKIKVRSWVEIELQLNALNEKQDQIAPSQKGAMASIQSEKQSLFAFQDELLRSLLKRPSQSLEDIFLKLCLWQSTNAPSESDLKQLTPAEQLANSAINDLYHLLSAKRVKSN